MAEQPNNTDSYKLALSFEQHLNDVYDSVTGYRSELIPDREDPSKFYLSRSKRDGVIPVCNEAGGEFLVGELRKSVYNRHTALADLTQDEIADLACNTAQAIIDCMMFYSNKYGVKELAVLETVGLDLDMGIYTFLTSLRNGELRKMGVSILTVTVINRPQEQQPQSKGLMN